MRELPQGFTAQEWDAVERRYPDNQPQENPVTEVQENPIVSKLREAFDTACNAIVEGTELAKLVSDLRSQVQTLSSEVTSLRNDLDYVRNRNKELDEQVTQVRRARDEAIQEASNARAQLGEVTNDREALRATVANLQSSVKEMTERLDGVHKERDDMELRAIEAEEKLVAAEAKLLHIEELFKPKDEAKPVSDPQASTTAWPSQSQPRDPVTQQFLSPYESGSQGTY